MAEFTEVLKQKERMHEQFNKFGCDSCPIAIDIANNGYKEFCGTFIFKYPQEAEEIITCLYRDILSAKESLARSR